MPLDNAALARFIETARQSGTVSTDQMRRAFPVDTMRAEDIAALVLRLEEAGVSVEIDPALFSPKHGASLNPLGTPGKQPEQTSTRTGSDSRTSPDFQASSPGVAPPRAPSSVDSSSQYPSGTPSAGKRVIWVVVILLVIAFLAIWWLSKV